MWLSDLLTDLLGYWIVRCIAALAIVATVVMAAHNYGTKMRAKEAAELAKNIEKWKVPYKTSEGGGCEIWTFNPDGKHWRYFTKCPGHTTVTDNTWLECTSNKAHTCTARNEPLTVKGD